MPTVFIQCSHQKKLAQNSRLSAFRKAIALFGAVAATLLLLLLPATAMRMLINGTWVS